MIAGVLGKTMEELAQIDTTKFFENPDMFAMIYRMPNLVEDFRAFLPKLLAEGFLD